MDLVGLEMAVMNGMWVLLNLSDENFYLQKVCVIHLNGTGKVTDE